MRYFNFNYISHVFIITIKNDWCHVFRTTKKPCAFICFIFYKNIYFFVFQYLSSFFC